jgi:hypothetical protein
MPGSGVYEQVARAYAGKVGLGCNAAPFPHGETRRICAERVAQDKDVHADAYGEVRFLILGVDGVHVDDDVIGAIGSGTATTSQPRFLTGWVYQHGRFSESRILRSHCFFPKSCIFVLKRRRSISGCTGP